MRSLCFVLFLSFSFTSFAAELNGVTLDDSVTVQSKKLILNGIGLRKVRRFGFPVKVYVGGLYLEEKSADSDAIIASDKTKQMVMEFVRPVDRKALVKGFLEGYEKNCKAECDNRELFTEFKGLVVNVRKKNRMTITFEKAQVTVESTGPNAKKGTLKSAALSKNLLSLFINKKAPPTQEFRSAVLGE